MVSGGSSGGAIRRGFCLSGVIYPLLVTAMIDCAPFNLNGGMSNPEMAH